MSDDSKERDILHLLDELKEKLQADPALAERVAERIERSKDNAELRAVILRNRAQQQFYYNEEYAAALRPQLQKLIRQECKVLQFSKDNYPGKSLRTVYKMIYEAWQWLRDHDPERDSYRALYNEYKIAERPGKRCVRIAPKRNAPEEFVAEELMEDNIEVASGVQALVELQKSIDEFIKQEMANEMEVKEWPNVKLSADDIEEVKDSLAGLEGITAIVEANRVKILRKRLE